MQPAFPLASNVYTTSFTRIDSTAVALAPLAAPESPDGGVAARPALPDHGFVSSVSETLIEEAEEVANVSALAAHAGHASPTPLDIRAAALEEALESLGEQHPHEDLANLLADDLLALA